MDGKELRARRKALGLTQAELGARLGYHRDHVGLMERGTQPVPDRTALAVSALDAGSPSVGIGPLPPLSTTDPMERLVERALQRAGILYEPDRDGRNPVGLDFYLPDHDVHIEVKRMHTGRVAEQMSRAPNVIVAQGEAGVRFLAQAIEAMGKREV